MSQTPVILLASGSATRAKLLQDSGLCFRAISPGVDEGVIKKSLRRQGDAIEAVADALAQAKAAAVAIDHPGALVIGADQMLACEGQWLDRADSRAEAVAQLQFLSGRCHRLISAAAVFQGSSLLWQTRAEARLTMRPLSQSMIERYLDRVGDDVLRSVGTYQIEGLGLALFDRIEGDWFTILGLPLLPLLQFLRSYGMPLED